MVCAGVKYVGYTPWEIRHWFHDGPGRFSAVRRDGPEDASPVVRERPGQFPCPCPDAEASLVMVALCFWPLPTHLCFVLLLVAEHSAGFQIPLLGAMATVLAVIGTAVIVVLTLARKVMTLAAYLSPGHPVSAILVLSCRLSFWKWSLPLFIVPSSQSLLCLSVALFTLFCCPFPCLGAPERLDPYPRHLAVAYNSWLLLVP